MLSEEDIAYGRESFRQMRAILGEVERERQRRALRPPRPKVPGDWCYRCSVPHLITSNHRLQWTYSGAPPWPPCDNWPPKEIG